MDFGLELIFFFLKWMFVDESGCEVDESGFWLGCVLNETCIHPITSSYGTRTKNQK